MHTSMYTAAFIAALAIGVNCAILSPRQNPPTCNPPAGTRDATYSACVLPVDSATASSETAITDLQNYMVSTMGCKADELIGITNRPIGRVTVSRCTHPGPEIVTAGVPGWSINSQFNEAPCLPGDRCL